MSEIFEIYMDIKSTLKHRDQWEAIITQWLKNNQVYLLKNDFNDCAFWHNEMANISCMIGAIWKIGGVSISEYTTTKGNGKKDYGRADLYFKIDNIQYLVESKFIKETETNPINEKKIQLAMKRAIHGCRDIKDEYILHKMALVFAVPYHTTSINLTNFSYDIKVMLKMNNSYLEYSGKKYNAVYLFGQLYEEQK